MQIVQPPPGNMSYTIQIRTTSALRNLDPELGINDLPDVWSILRYTQKQALAKEYKKNIPNRLWSLLHIPVFYWKRLLDV